MLHSIHVPLQCTHSFQMVSWRSVGVDISKLGSEGTTLKLRLPSHCEIILQWKEDCPVCSYRQTMAVRRWLKELLLGLYTCRWVFPKVLPKSAHLKHGNGGLPTSESSERLLNQCARQQTRSVDLYASRCMFFSWSGVCLSAGRRKTSRTGLSGCRRQRCQPAQLRSHSTRRK